MAAKKKTRKVPARKRAVKATQIKKGTKCTLSPEIHREIVELVEQGNYLETAFAIAGVNKSTGTMWLHRGRKYPELEPYATFAVDVDAARARSEAVDLGFIGAAAVKDWRAAAWRLERKYPAKYGPQIKHTVDNEFRKFFDGLATFVEEGKMTIELFEDILELAANGGGREGVSGED